MAAFYQASHAELITDVPHLTLSSPQTLCSTDLGFWIFAGQSSPFQPHIHGP